MKDRIRREPYILPHCQDCEEIIGVSTRCCYTCRFFIKKLSATWTNCSGTYEWNQDEPINASHGLIYPWTPPANAPEEIKRQVLVELVRRMDNKLWETADGLWGDPDDGCREQ